MKICYLNHNLESNTGAGRFCSALMNAMKAVAPEVKFTVLTSETGSGLRSTKSYAYTEEQPVIYPNKFRLLLALPKIRAILKDCDIIHALDGWPYGVIAALCSLGLGKKIIITAIGTGAIQPLYRPLKKWFMRWAYQKAYLVTAVSNNTKKEILKVIPNLKIEVVSHGVDFDKFRRAAEKYERIEKLKPYILSIGAWKPRKGFEYSLAAFNEIKAKFPRLNYVIISNGPREKNMERVVFFDNVEENFLIALYKNAELFILLPQDVGKDIEGFGLVFLEAAACGLPVIATQETSADDAVLDGTNGILVPPEDYRVAAEALGKILKDNSLSSKFAEASLDFAKRMTWQKAAFAYRKIYEL